MTRILYWNINNFSLPKIQVATPAGLAAQATQRLTYIVQSIMRGPVGGPIPDIIIVVEVYSRVREVGAEGTVLNSGSHAGQAVLTLLDQIRADATLGTAAAGSNWCVVPPLNLGEFGQREAVAVFYNAVNLQFTGPNLFWQLYGPPGPIIGQSQPVNAVTRPQITNYPVGWARAFTGAALNRATGFLGMPAVPENQLAGEWQYYNAGTARLIPSPRPPAIPRNRIQFPSQGCRGPFLTRFLDLTAMMPRTLNLFTVHTSPSSARNAVCQMGNVPEMTAVANGEVNIVLGDFNVDTFGGNAWAYNWMLPLYTMALDPRDPRVNHAGLVIQDRKPYCMTHLLPTAHATPYNNVGVAQDPQHNVYPRYGYMGSLVRRSINDSGAIDNIFTAYGAGAGEPAANITVINTLTGTPYNLGVPPAGVTAELTGGLPYNSSLTPPNLLVTSPPANAGIGGIDSLAPGAAGAQALFQAWQNFGRVHSTSDHLPLMIDV